jgi:very-short-patch-repair endonuclease
MMGRHVKPQPGVVVHRVAALDIRDIRLHQGFPVTAPARTLIDCAAGSLAIDRLLNEARALSLVTDAEIHAAMGRCPGRTGIGAMRALLAAEQDAGFTRSEAERILERIVADAGLQRPTFNTRVAGMEVDALWPAERVVVEVDGYRAHGHHAAFQRDRARDNQLVTAGYLVLRFTWHQLNRRPMAVLATIVRALTVRTHTNLAVAKTVGSPQT